MAPTGRENDEVSVGRLNRRPPEQGVYVDENNRINYVFRKLLQAVCLRYDYFKFK